MTWWYRTYAKEQTAQQRADYEAAEDAAKSTGVGLCGKTLRRGAVGVAEEMKGTASDPLAYEIALQFLLAMY